MHKLIITQVDPNMSHHPALAQSMKKHKIPFLQLVATDMMGGFVLLFGSPGQG